MLVSIINMPRSPNAPKTTHMLEITGNASAEMVINACFPAPNTYQGA